MGWFFSSSKELDPALSPVPHISRARPLQQIPGLRPDDVYKPVAYEPMDVKKPVAYEPRDAYKDRKHKDFRNQEPVPTETQPYRPPREAWRPPQEGTYHDPCYAMARSEDQRSRSVAPDRSRQERRSQDHTKRRSRSVGHFGQFVEQKRREHDEKAATKDLRHKVEKQGATINSLIGALDRRTRHLEKLEKSVKELEKSIKEREQVVDDKLQLLFNLSIDEFSDRKKLQRAVFGPEPPTPDADASPHVENDQPRENRGRSRDRSGSHDGHSSSSRRHRPRDESGTQAAYSDWASQGPTTWRRAESRGPPPAYQPQPRIMSRDHNRSRAGSRNGNHGYGPRR